jgi:nicotinamide-nucleotide amidase
MKPSLRLAHLLISTGKTLATAESCTGGLIGHTLTNIPGSSAWFAGGVIAYTNEAKTTFLSVPAYLIKDHGAVSAPVAKTMAQGARRRFRTDFAIATTGIAGPTGGTPPKPVGLVFIAIASAKRIIVKKLILKGTRLSIKNQTLQKALQMLEKEF